MATFSPTLCLATLSLTGVKRTQVKGQSLSHLDQHEKLMVKNSDGPSQTQPTKASCLLPGSSDSIPAQQLLSPSALQRGRLSGGSKLAVPQEHMGLGSLK